MQQRQSDLLPQPDFLIVAKTPWRDPKARSRRGSGADHYLHQYNDRRRHRLDCQSIQLSFPVLVLEGGRSPPFVSESVKVKVNVKV